jgi:hypothetical protein
MSGSVLARRFPALPSIVKARSGLIALTAAGALSISGAASAAASTLPAHAAPALSHTAAQTRIPNVSDEFAEAPFSFGGVQLKKTLAAAKASAPKAPVAKTPRARVETTRTAAVTTHAATRSAIHPAATLSGSPQQIAQGMLGQFGWSGSQFSCLQPLWAQESGWSVTASNPGSGAYGIPQALPGGRMAGAGPDWQSDAATQIRWGLRYIQDTYGSPCGAWSHEQADGWY